jgi:hypothetical protein
MANLEKIMAETSKSYDNSRKALNNQINAISGDLAAQQNRINAQYAQQGKSLDNQRNWQAQASSMAASRNGGSFGGSSEIANKKYYQQAYVPAVTQMQTNQANDLSSAESDANQRRLSLQQTLAGLNDEASKYAMQRYDAAVAQEKEDAYRRQQLALQKQQLAAQNAWQNYLTPTNTATNPYVWSQNGAGGSSFNNANTGRAVTFGTYATGAGARGNANLMALAGQSLNADEYARLQRIVGAQANTKHSALKTTRSNAYQNKKYLSAADNDFMRRLGLTF